MRSVLIISHQSGCIDSIRKYLPHESSQFLTHSSQEGLELAQNVGADLVVVDTDALKDRVFHVAAQLKAYQSSCVVICILSSESLESDLPDLASEERKAVDFFLRQPLRNAEVESVIRNALEKQMLLQELDHLRSEQANSTARTLAGDTKTIPQNNPLQHSPAILGGVAKMLGTNFDLDRLTTLFLDLTADMLTLHRVSLALYDDVSAEYRIEGCRGLLPKIASNVRLKPADALPSWLVREARLITTSQIESIPSSSILQRLRSQLDMLQAVACIPLLVQGHLVGILSLGPRITGGHYTDLELETVFILANQVATFIGDIRFHRQIQHQKSYVENILAHMNCGVIAISPDEKIAIYNRRAADILEIPTANILNENSNALPAPLGELLFETLKHGKKHHKQEIRLTVERTPLEISSYQVVDDGGMIGGVMVLEDLRQKKELEQAHQRSVEVDLFNRMMATMAHEIKNPLVSIQTFIEILPLRYNDHEFRNHFLAIVQNDVKQLDEMVEKMASFADAEPYQFESSDIGALLEECANAIKEDYSELDVEIALDNENPIPPLSYDKARLLKAFTYIIKYLIQDIKPPNPIVVKAVETSDPTPKSVQITIAGKHAPESAEPLTDFLGPPSQPQTQTIDLGLWVSQKIVEDHGGQLEAQRSEAERLTFTIRLPYDERLVKRALRVDERTARK